MQRSSYLAGFLIAIATALAAVWMLMLPIFLSPDEDTHYDYALTLYSAGRPVVASEDRVGRDTHPVVAYLMNATHARQQRLDRNVGADPGYGTLAYFRHLDALAPHVNRTAFHDQRIDPAPYISKVYPIGYYALVAAAITATASISHDSAVAEFFVARLLSVLLLVPTLLFTWLALLKTSLRPKRALLVLACIALLPLSNWTAASVQPDNLAYLLVAAALYVALRLRDAPSNVAMQTILGLLLGALIAVKQHYFAAVFVTTAVMLASRLDFRRHTLAGVRCLAFLAVPPLASFLATRPFLTPPASGVCTLDRGVSLAHQHGLSALFSYVVNGLFTAFANTFLNGLGLQSFWLYFTAYRDAPITIVKPFVTSAMLVLISAVSIVVLTLFLMRLMQTVRRLARIATHRSLRSALRVASSNVLVNGYLAFFVIIYGFEISVEGFVPIQGRYWLPFVAGLWLITIDIAPRALPRRLRHVVARGLSTALLLCVIVANAFSLPSLYSRFYANVAPLTAKDETLAELHVSRSGDILDFTGYAVDRRDASPVRQSVLLLDGRRLIHTQAAESPGLACDLETTLANAGFEARVRAANLAPGRHRLSLFVKVPWSSELIDTGERVRFGAAATQSVARRTLRDRP
jgi:hypothetical protein